MKIYITPLHLSILNIKLPRIKHWIKTRKKLAKIYFRELKNTSLELPIKNKDCDHVYHLYVVYHPKRDLILNKLRQNKIYLNINYPYPIHKMKAYSNIVCSKCDCLPITEKMANGIFSLPLYPKLKESELLKFTKTFRKILRSI